MPTKHAPARRLKNPKRENTIAIVRLGLRLVGVLLILIPMVMWLLVRLDWLEASSLRVGPPVAIIGVVLFAIAAIFKKRWE